METRQAAYLATVRREGYWLPPGYTDHADAWAAVCAALRATARPAVPCNNDLLAANFIDDGERTRLIDYEYSGNNDACFELGNTSTECDLDDDQVDALVTAYYGEPRRDKLARARLQALVSAYGWSLWGAIQAAASQIDHDFETWGLERFEKAARGFTSPSFERLLEDATGEH
jgi:thiamine kinase-like enzyme